MCHTLVYTEFIDKRTRKGKMHIVLVVNNAHNAGGFFYNTTEHILNTIYCFEVIY